MKKLIASGAVIVYVTSAIVFCTIIPAAPDSSGSRRATATDFGVMCINAVYPAIDIETADSRDNEKAADEGAVVDGENSGSKKTVVSGEETAQPVVLGDDPLVLIIHTHATESYLPASQGNFHSKGETNTVREVGNVLAGSLEKEGVSVIHDSTLHDSPSYNNSYYRSYDTAESLLAKYPTVKCVIDLHRDAISADGAAATVSVGGKECANYSFVVGSLASTYGDNMKFISGLNKTAADSYDGYTGKVLERGYRYNQDLSSKYLLLEVGYNRNHIDEAKNSAYIFGKILADTLKKGY